MSDPKGEHESATHEQPPDTRLAERLLARGTRSLGVIDVRRAEAHYARIMDWLARRTPLLEHLMSRYGLTEDDGARQVGLAFAGAHEHASEQRHGGARRIDEAAGLSTAPHNSATPDSFAARAVEQTFTSVALVPDDPSDRPSEPLRIGRRGVPTFSPARPKTLTETDTHTELSDDEKLTFKQDDQSPQRASGPRAPLPVKEIAAPEHVARDAQGATQDTRPLLLSVASPPLSTSSPPSPASSQREAASSPRVRQFTADAEAVFAAPASHSDDTGPREDSRSTHVVAPERGDTSDTVVVPEEVWKSTSARAADARAFVAGESEAKHARAEASLPFALAREMPATGRVRDSMTSQESDTLPLAAPPRDGERAEQARRSRPTPAVGAAAFEQVATGVADASASARGRAGAHAEINVERLTEQVSRHLARRLLVERERRGLGRK